MKNYGKVNICLTTSVYISHLAPETYKTSLMHIKPSFSRIKFTMVSWSFFGNFESLFRSYVFIT